MIEILAVAGNGGNSARWAELPTPLEEGVLLTPINLPGFDGRPLPIANPTVHDFGQWLCDEATSRNRDHSIIVLGTGIGASIALQTAQHCEGVDGYIFHAPVGPNLDTRLLPKLMRPSLMRTAVKKAIGGPIGRAILRRRFSETLTSEAVDNFGQGYLDCDAFEVMWDILTAEWFDHLQPIAKPSILIWGADDGVLGANLAHGFESVLPNAEAIIEQDWAHYPMLENPEHFASTMAGLARSLVAEGGTP